ncbi:hypothetical protein [Marinimicrobium sp. ABcell2]|uniref:hypothetical protein n=1 Tax=Marinimicrobium sp. ABcell2 TaxID=3069751 RepID=UPI0027B223FE|nr:hypothetical protein [Marinimicrobium sp. ABcell2]MDQ2077470.1 hypothetical protein [Marinimicrobium sp. ABcell2]
MENNVAGIHQNDELIVNESGQVTPVTPEHDRYIINRLGYKIEVKNERGEWLDRITIVDDNGSATHIHGLADLATKDEDLNYVLTSMINRALFVYLPTTVKDYLLALNIFVKEFNNADESVDKTIENVLTKAASGHYANQLTIRRSVTVMKHLVGYLVAYEHPNLEIDRAQELAGARVGDPQNNYAKLFLMDDSYGPFTREEMGVIQAALDDDDLAMPLECRVISQLCFEWGLRPIQISLLKEDDFHYNPQSDIYWLNVPRVKQKHRNRRSQFKKRLLSNRLGQLIQQMIDGNAWIKTYYGVNDMPLFQRRFSRYLNEDNGLIKVNDTNVLNPHRPKYGTEKDSFSFHVNTFTVNRRMHELEAYLPLSPRTGNPFNITAYRFRYTLGTASVTQGMTAEEVAERLDHSGTTTVKHYFKNTEELWEVIQEATTSRMEQGHFVAKFMTKEPEGKNIYSVDITERTTFTSVGKCHKGSACHLEPAVACYSCSEFKPNENLEGHKRAKSVIIEARSRSQSQSSVGEIQHIFDDALVGVEAAIIHVEKAGDVVGIYDCKPKDIKIGSIIPTLELGHSDE